ncbi:MAG: single-stranded DNA-binding protein [Clostridia bacterium]|nr:single-stranded DNA-binding protein [Clostridia bacterium]
MLNVVALMGRLTADPELRYTPNNLPVVSFTLAVDRSYVRQGEQRQTDFIDVVAWRNTAEFVSRYFRKGQLVAVNGSIQTRSYEDKQGNRRKAFEIVADNVHFAEPKRDSYGQGNQGGYGSYNQGGYSPQPAPGYEQSAPVQQPAVPQQPAAYSSGEAGDFEPIEDDLPF